MKPLDSWQLWYLSLCRCCTNYTCCACFLSLSLKKKKTLLHWQDFTLNSIQTLTQYSKKNIHNHIFLVAVCFHRKYLLLYSDIAQPHFDLNGAKGWWVLSAVIIMMLLCCECYFGQVSKAEMIIFSSFVYVVKKNGKYLLKKKKSHKTILYIQSPASSNLQKSNAQKIHLIILLTLYLVSHWNAWNYFHSMEHDSLLM